MRRAFPKSLLFFAATGVVFALQAFPVTGIFLMFMLAPFWSIFLVNAGMIGVASEALTGRVSRAWLVLPVAFYGGYWAVAAQDHATLRALSASYDAANARVSIAFDPDRQALVFDEGEDGAWLTQNYGLPVVYSANGTAGGFRADRMMDQETCARIRAIPTARAAGMYVSGFPDGDAIGARTMEKRFCELSMPERPELPVVRVSRKEEKVQQGWLPVTRVTTIVSTPDGRGFGLLGGVAAPLSWIPMPVMGCMLNSGAPSWNCDAGFWRNGFTPIVSGNTRYGGDSTVLAKALGLKHVAIADRRGADPTRVLDKVAAVERETLTRQLANIDAMIADPLIKNPDWQVGVIQNRPEVLASRADAIMTGLERAAAAPPEMRYRARESGRILAGLLAHVAREQFLGFKPRLLALYAGANDEHWLWESEPLLRRLGDLGTDALPYLVNRRASTSSVNGAGIEGLCRVGAAGRTIAEPALLALWNRSRGGFDRAARDAMYVAMRRIGITPPPLPDDKHGQFAELQEEWGDISPQSPARVCSTRAEAQARREEKIGGKRRTNLD